MHRKIRRPTALASAFLSGCGCLARADASSSTPSELFTTADSLVQTPATNQADRSLIVGGSEAPIGRYAYSASLSVDGDYDTHLCGGSLIAPDIVLTVAHCAGWPGPYRRVDIDQHNLDDRNEEHEYFFTREAVMHPKHVLLPDEFSYDFAIVKLYGASTQTAPVKLNRDPRVPSMRGEPLTVFGWGFLDDDTPQNMVKSPVLLETEIGYVPNDVCIDIEGIDPKTQKSFSYGSRYIHEETMCAHHPDRGSCLGDSGSPLIVRGNTAEEDVQVGLVSFGLDCNHDTLPGVYARVSSEIEWITEQVCELSVDPPADFNCPPRPSRGGIKTFVTVEIRLGNWVPYSTGWLLESADGKTIYAYRSTQTYGNEYLDQVVTETIAVDNDQNFRFVVMHNDALGFCCSWYGEGYYRVYQGRGTSGNVLVEGTGEFDTYTKEEMFSIGGNPPPVAPAPTPKPPPVPPPGTPFISVVLDLDFGPEHLAWGIKAADGTYVDYRSTNTFKDFPEGTITEIVYLPSDDVLPEYDFTMYNVNGGWVGTYQVFMGSVNTGRLLFEGDSEFTNRRVLEKQQFVVLESDYEANDWIVPSPTTNGGEDVANQPTPFDTNGPKPTSSSVNRLTSGYLVLTCLLLSYAFV